MTNQPTEIAIVGGGMGGGALALGLAQHGFAVTVIEHAEPRRFVPARQRAWRDRGNRRRSVPRVQGLGGRDRGR
ncbi:NAD(P)-binding protein, partial [Escherichia coli]|uniref:NAD(P)-binding protein n=1 Tax=Escherichia coli TaxID=562 RepID=UPI002169419E